MLNLYKCSRVSLYLFVTPDICTSGHILSELKLRVSISSMVGQASGHSIHHLKNSDVLFFSGPFFF